MCPYIVSLFVPAGGSCSIGWLLTGDFGTSVDWSCDGFCLEEAAISAPHTTSSMALVLILELMYEEELVCETNATVLIAFCFLRHRRICIPVPLSPFKS